MRKRRRHVALPKGAKQSKHFCLRSASFPLAQMLARFLPGSHLLLTRDRVVLSSFRPPHLHIQTTSDSIFLGSIILVYEIMAFGTLLGRP